MPKKMLERFKNTWIFIVLYTLILPFLLIFHYRKVWLNKKINAKRINVKELRKRGDLKFDLNIISAQFFWTKRSFNWDELFKISGFVEEVTKEKYERFISLEFEKGNTIVLNLEASDQKKFAEKISEKLNLGFIDWEKKITDETPIIFFTNNKGRFKT